MNRFAKLSRRWTPIRRSVPWLTAAATTTIALSFLISGCGNSDSVTTEASAPIDPRSAVVPGDCVIDAPVPGTVCGLLRVAERRTDPASRMLELPYMIVPAQATFPERDPIVVLTGGPLSVFSTLKSLGADVLADTPPRAKRDLIFIEFRGATYTRPQNLDCSELDIERFTGIDDVLTRTIACRDRLKAGGAQLAAYDTTTIARDFEDARILLGRARGFTQWNAVGSSYGSRLALALMRDAGAGLRSVVLDGPFPLQVQRLYDPRPLDALTEVQTACNGIPACAAAYPDLRARFAAVLEPLQVNPVQLASGETVNASQVLAALHESLAAGDYAAIPLVLDRLARRDWAGANALLPLAEGPALRSETFGFGISISCIDGGPSFNPQALPAGGAGWPDGTRRLAAQETLQLQCAPWTAGLTLPAPATAPARSAVPTLVTVGQFDPATPVTDAGLLPRDLTALRTVVFPGRGHALLETDRCMQNIVAAFIDRPTAAPDTACLDAPSSVAFLLPGAVNVSPNLALAAAEAVRGDPTVPSALAAASFGDDAAGYAAAAAGKRNPSASAPAQATDRFRAASIGKMFTAAAVLRLVELGQLDLDASIATLLPAGVVAGLHVVDGVDRTAQITPRMLLSHTSGLANFFADGPLVDGLPPFYAELLADTNRLWTPEETIAWNKTHLPPVAPPGIRFHYADTNYQLLGLIVQSRTGQTLEATVRSLVFDPLGMSSTYQQYTEPARGEAGAVLLNFFFGDLDVTSARALSADWASGGWITTSADLNRFLRGLASGALFDSPRTLEAMRTPSALSQATDADGVHGVGGYGYGLGLELRVVNGATLIGHEGAFGSFAYYLPDQDSVIVGTLNQLGSDSATLLKRCLQAALARN